MVYTFWEGKMPAYIKLCLKTWRVDYKLLNYDSLKEYISIPETAKQFTLPQIADYIRVHLLRDYGGYWLDADTIMLTDKLPTEMMMGDPVKRTNSIGYLHSEKRSPMFSAWAEYQNSVIEHTNNIYRWSSLGNDFSDPYVRFHKEITIADITNRWPETYLMVGNAPRWEKYKTFYFDAHRHSYNLRPTDILMLHNSWTPVWYKELSEQEVLAHDCTLSNILREVL